MVLLECRVGSGDGIPVVSSGCLGDACGSGRNVVVMWWGPCGSVVAMGHGVCNLV